MLVTLSGIVTLVSAVYSNALSPMLVTLSGIVTLTNDLQSLNAAAGMLVVQPNSILYPPPMGPAVFSCVHPLNAQTLNVVTLSGIVTLTNDVQLLNDM